MSNPSHREFGSLDIAAARLTEFHEAIGAPKPDDVEPGSVKLRLLRIRLLLEELIEYTEASGVTEPCDLLNAIMDHMEKLPNPPNCEDFFDTDPDPVGMTHELADVMVVAIGAGTAQGLPVSTAFDEVMDSNMTKVDPLTGKVQRRPDGKILKGPHYRPPRIAHLVFPTTVED